MGRVHKRKTIVEKEIGLRQPVISNFPCIFCPMILSNFYNYEAHVNMEHTKERPFQCKLCDASFGKREIYKNHMNIHQGITTNCPRCDKPFNTPANRLKHMKNVNCSKPKVIRKWRHAGVTKGWVPDEHVDQKKMRNRQKQVVRQVDVKPRETLQIKNPENQNEAQTELRGSRARRITNAKQENAAPKSVKAPRQVKKNSNLVRGGTCTRTSKRIKAGKAGIPDLSDDLGEQEVVGKLTEVPRLPKTATVYDGDCEELEDNPHLEAPQAGTSKSIIRTQTPDPTPLSSLSSSSSSSSSSSEDDDDEEGQNQAQKKFKLPEFLQMKNQNPTFIPQNHYLFGDRKKQLFLPKCALNISGHKKSEHTYACGICQTEFPKRKTVARHVMNTHDDTNKNKAANKELLCCVCKKPFPNDDIKMWKLATHIISKHRHLIIRRQTS